MEGGVRDQLRERASAADGCRWLDGAGTLRRMVPGAVLLALAMILAAPASGVAASLPDGRVYEQVSPTAEGEPYGLTVPVNPNNPTESFPTTLPVRAAADGNAIVYVGEPGLTTGEQLYVGDGGGNEWLARRTANGWQPEEITPANNRRGGYEFFSGDLATAAYKGGRTPPVPGVEPGCFALYARPSATGVFQPLFTAGSSLKNCGNPLYVGAASGGSPVIFQSEAALTADSEAASEVPEGHEKHGRPLVEGCLFGCNLYLADAGHLVSVNVLNGVPVPSATFGGSGHTAEAPDFNHAISSDGSRIFWTSTQPGTSMEHVYVFENGATNVAVSGAEPAEYWGASPDGHYAFYTEAGRLWRFDTDTNSRVALTPEGAKVRGVVGLNEVGEDGGYVYFVAEGVLAPPNANGEPTLGAPNLYLLHGETTTETTTFVAQLAPEDNRLYITVEGIEEASQFGGDWRSGLGERTAQVTPDGTHIAFESVRALTGYNSGFARLPEVYVFSASSDALACASCNPTGAPADREGEGFETKVPTNPYVNTSTARWLSQDGNRVFFNSTQALVPGDRNDATDVYEWERPGAPSEPSNTCTAAAASEVTRGCTFLLSDGTGYSASELIDADAAGDNVFFEQVGALGPFEGSSGRTLFDARVDGGFSLPSDGCAGAGCQVTVPPAPSPQTPASSTVAGGGNLPPPAPVSSHASKGPTRQQKLAAALKACKKPKNKQRRKRCERRARSLYGPSAHGAASRRHEPDRRANP